LHPKGKPGCLLPAAIELQHSFMGDICMNTETPRILAFYSAPNNTAHIRLDKEHRAVEKILRDLHLEPTLIKRLHATTIDDLTQALMEREYEIVQFSGHGARDGIFLEDRTLQKDMFIPADQVAKIVRETTPRLRAAIFLSCYSANAIDQLVDSAPYLITVTGAADDEASIDFITQFYHAYLRFESIEKAFNIAQNYVAIVRKVTDLHANLTRRALVKGENRILFQVFPSGKDDSILLDLTEAEADITSLNIPREAFLGLLSRKIRIHRWIFSSPRQRVVLPLGPYFGLFSWENANDVVVCNRILKIKPNVVPQACEAWASLIVCYNDHFMAPYRTNPELHIASLKKALDEYKKTYSDFFETGEKAKVIQAQAPEQFMVNKAVISANLEMAENKYHRKEYDAVMVYLETVLSTIHNLLDDLTNILTI
jgi:hypothetical protein